MNPQNLLIKCPTWDHVESFCYRKVKSDGTLTARVPFCPEAASAMILSLELPSGVVVEIPAVVREVRSAPDGVKSAIKLHLIGFTPELRSRLDQSVAASRDRDGSVSPSPADTGPAISRTRTGAPVPVPTDAPVDEPVEVVEIPSVDDVPEADRAIFLALRDEMAAYREKAAHEVLGVDWEASVSDIRTAYFSLAKKYHPDVHARHRSRAIALLVSELFIYVNRAYDRMRESAVAAGQAIVAGPALLPHQGWLASFDDLGTVRPRPPLRSDDLSGRAAAVAERLATGRKRSVAGSVSVRTVAVGSAAPQITEAPPEAAPTRPAPATGSSAHDRPERLEEELFDDMEPRSTRSGMQALVGTDEFNGRDVDQISQQVDVLIGERRFQEAKLALAELLDARPRDRIARARYHYVCGELLAAAGDRVEAVTQFEIAVAHDPLCQPARIALESSKPERIRRESFFKKLFGK